VVRRAKAGTRGKEERPVVKKNEKTRLPKRGGKTKKRRKGGGVVSVKGSHNIHGDSKGEGGKSHGRARANQPTK